MINNIILSIFSSALLLWAQASFAETTTEVSCYAEIKGEEITLDGTCTLSGPDDWQEDDEFTIVLMTEKDESDPKYYFYYLGQYKLLGKAMWSANMNGGQNSIRAQNFLGEDFDIHWDKSGKTGGVCWENVEHLICFNHSLTAQN